MAYHIQIIGTYLPRRCGLACFTRDLGNALQGLGETVASVNVTAIDREGLTYEHPVDGVIDQYSAPSWYRAGEEILVQANTRSDPTIVLIQHAYGLDPDEQGNDGKGRNYVNLSRALHDSGLMTLVYVHTVLEHPNKHQRSALCALAEHSDGLLVTTHSAVDLLASQTYGIQRSRIRHFDHGICLQDPSQRDRRVSKRQYGLEGRLLISSLGFHSPDKGLPYSIRAYGRLLDESTTFEQRQRLVYLIAGCCHPEFVKRDSGRPYREYQADLKEAIRDAGLRACQTDDLAEIDFDLHDIVFLDAFLNESTLRKLYTAADIVVLPYLNMEQICSGILADALGAGRVPVATKFKYATEVIDPHWLGQTGVIIGPHARGILVDAGTPSIEQMAQALDYLIYNPEERLDMEMRAHERGFQMRWQNTAWELMQSIRFVRDKQDQGRGFVFTRERASVYEKRNALSRTKSNLIVEMNNTHTHMSTDALAHPERHLGHRS
jgi:glycosyltransferase involved in cell wall biosynthesis